LKKYFFILTFLFLLFSATAFSQKPQFSIATDLDFQRSFKKEQRYHAVGQTAQFLFHFTPKDGAYCWIAYYSFGKFNNDLTASAKLPATNPQEIDYVNHAQMRFKQISLGWKHYLKGAYNSEDGWSLYGYAGFGLMLGRIINAHSISIDTAQYTIPVLAGKAHYKRLTMDLGLGVEIPLGGDIFLYTETRVWVPTTDYPSKYIFVNKNAPLLAALNFGLRILFY
jgi:hypothetical protein